MDKLVKQLLNSLKCPICKKQIDTFSSKRLTKISYDFACVSDHSHYKIGLSDEFIRDELVSFYNKNKKISIYQYKNPLFEKTTIYIDSVDLEKRVIEGAPRLSSSFDKVLFDFQKINESQLISKIKTILVFQ